MKMINEGFLARLTKEYAEDTTRKEDNIPNLIRVDFTDNKGKFHKKGYRIEDGNPSSLYMLIRRLVKKRGNESDLNDIDVSNINTFNFTDESLFGDKKNHGMFMGMKDFNCDISGWNVSNVKSMLGLFSHCENFDGDISKWDVSNVINMTAMFSFCYKFNGNLNKWNVSKVDYMFCIFAYCKNLDKKNIEDWKVNAMYSSDFFTGTKFDGNPPKWFDK